MPVENLHASDGENAAGLAGRVVIISDEMRRVGAAGSADAASAEIDL